MSLTLIPPPTPTQTKLLVDLQPKIAQNLLGMNARGLVVIQMLGVGSNYKLGFTPAKSLNLSHVMAMGVPEEIATSVLESVRTYDDLQEVPVLVTEKDRSERVGCSLVLLDVRPHPASDAKETLH